MSTETRKYVQEYANADEDQRMQIVQTAKTALSGTQFKVFKKEIKAIEEDEKNAMGGYTSGSDAGDTGKTPDPSGSGKAPAPDPKPVVASDREVEAFWKLLDGMSGDDLIDEDVTRDFQYIGFDPNLIMKSIVTKGKAANKTNAAIMSDISKLCTIAVIKGSITDNNLKKMSDAGKVAYGQLEAAYNLKKGGSKGTDPDVITVARVGAAFPGAISKILMQRPDFAKKFSGPFGSKVLPSYLRHQSAAACIPETAPEDLKAYLLGLITAFTSDQSKTISKSKDKPEELYDRQENFVNQTHSSMHPAENVRKQLFKTWTLIADYDKLNSVATNINKVVKEYVPMSKDDFTKTLNTV
ncbi:nucleocapsid [Trichoderma gamsii cogu-like virus 1]|nr:nucleocapsid [Trichoderma gamsii cogu-like virus 1]